MSIPPPLRYSDLDRIDLCVLRIMAALEEMYPDHKPTPGRRVASKVLAGYAEWMRSRPAERQLSPQGIFTNRSASSWS